MNSLTYDEITRMKTNDLVNYLTRAYREADEDPVVDCNTVLRELIVIRDKASEIPNELLKDILMNLLPVHPNGNEHIRAIQYGLASEAIIPELLDASEDAYPEWIGVMNEKDLLLVFDIVTFDNRSGAGSLARKLYTVICDRMLIEKVPDDTIYTFIRRQIPPTGDPYFRHVAEAMLRLVLMMHD